MMARDAIRRPWVALALGRLLLEGLTRTVLGDTGADTSPGTGRLSGLLQRELAAPGRWGAMVTRLDGTLLFATNAHEAFIPASTTKLFIGALALDHLGAGARIQTPVRVSRPPDADGTLRSDLWMLGQGDPTLGTAPRTASQGAVGSRDDALVPWVERWRSMGLRRIEGDLVLCDAAVQVPEYGPGWEEEDRAEAYAAPVSAFVVNDNSFRVATPPVSPGTASVPFRIDPPLPALEVVWAVSPGTNATHQIQSIRPGPDRPVEIRGRFATGTNGWSADLAVARPAQVFGELLRRTLERRGVPVTGTVRVSRSAEDCPPVAWDRWISPSLDQRLGLCLKPSQNLHAQLLLAEVGRDARSAAGSPSSPASPGGADGPTGPPNLPPARHDLMGLARLPALLARAGITPAEVHLEEGSGLSRSNRVSPAATVALLCFMAGHPHREAWKDSLPRAGVDGTLRNRFRSGRARGVVRAKTGSLRGVQALGGYVRTAGGEEWAFAIYAGEAGNAAEARARMDRWVEILAGEAPEDAGGSSEPGATRPPGRPPG